MNTLTPVLVPVSRVGKINEQPNKSADVCNITFTVGQTDAHPPESGVEMNAVVSATCSSMDDPNQVQNVLALSGMKSKHCDATVPKQNVTGLHVNPLMITESSSGHDMHIGSRQYDGLDENGKEVEEMDTKEIAERIDNDLKKYSIPQGVFRLKVVSRCQGTMSDLLRCPRPWSKMRPKTRKTFQKMLKWLQEPEFQRIPAVLMSVDHPCFVCKELCNEEDKTGHPVSVENCSRYGVPAADIQPDTIVCVACSSKHSNVNLDRKPKEEAEKSDKEVVKCTSKAQFICAESKGSEPVISDVKGSEPVCSDVESSKPVPSEIKGCEPVCNKKTVESDRSVDNETQSRCSLLPCKRKGSSIIPRKLSQLPPNVKEVVKTELGILDETSKVCTKCYKKIYRRCTSGKVWKKVEIPSCSDRPRTDSISGKQSSLKTKLYACGWCKFRSLHSSTVVKHHYRNHQRRELDVVRLKTVSPKLRSPSGIGFNCESCDYTGKLRHQLHLHNDRFHQNSQNRDGITDCESDNSYSPVYPYFYYNMTLPTNYFQMQEKYKLKDVKIQCKDIFKSGLEYLTRNVYDQGISKLCVDSITEEEFVSMATLYREDVSYCDTRVENYVPVDLEKLGQKEIKSIIRN